MMTGASSHSTQHCTAVEWPYFLEAASTSYIMMSNNVRRLFLPAGIFFNPYQELDGVVAKLTSAVQRPNNINAAHTPFTTPCRNSLWAVLFVLPYFGLVSTINTMVSWSAPLAVTRTTRNKFKWWRMQQLGCMCPMTDTSGAFWWWWGVVITVLHHHK